jgi:short-subunit dehydrogenase
VKNGNGRRFAVVTGASSGIGFELARQFATNGFDVLAVAEDERLEGAAAAILDAGTEVMPVRADLATYDGVEELCAAIERAGRPVDAVAINAGVGVGGDFARGTELDAELDVIRLNVLSTVHLAKRVVPGMVARGEGRILFTASIAATMPAAFTAVYGASKAFVLSFAEALREELKDSGVTVTALLPGPTETDFFRRAGMGDTRVGTEPKDDPAVVARHGFEALMAGRHAVVAGSARSKMQGRLNELLPEPLKARMHRRLAEPGSARR